MSCLKRGEEFGTAGRHGPHLDIGSRADDEDVFGDREIDRLRHAVIDIHAPDGESGKWRANDAKRGMGSKTDMGDLVRWDCGECGWIEGWWFVGEIGYGAGVRGTVGVVDVGE